MPLGGTAVGTGINAHPEYAFRACARLSTLTGLDVRETDNHFHAQATLDAAIAAHGAIRTIALSLWKIASDVRLMGMGPRAGLAEIALPETQPGSSIMPGKVNPVIVESLTMVVARVIGNDATIAFGQTGSFLELNVMLPVTAVALLESIDLLAAAALNFSTRAIEGLTATDRGPALVEQGLMLATALAPVHRLRRGGQARQGGVQERAHDPRAGPGARHGPGRARSAARSGRDDRAGPRRRPGRRLSRRPRQSAASGREIRPGSASGVARSIHSTIPIAVQAVPKTSQPADHGMSIARPPAVTAGHRSCASPARTEARADRGSSPTIATVWAAASAGPATRPARSRPSSIAIQRRTERGDRERYAEARRRRRARVAGRGARQPTTATDRTTLRRARAGTTSCR